MKNDVSQYAFKAARPLSPPPRLPLDIPIKIAIIEKNGKRAGDDGRWEEGKGVIFTTVLKSVQIVGRFSQNYRTANPASEPHIKWQRSLFPFPLPIVPRALSFSFSLASPQHKEVSAEGRVAHIILI